MILPPIEASSVFSPYFMPSYNEQIEINTLFFAHQLFPTFDFSNLSFSEDEKTNQDSLSLLADE